MLVDVHKGIVGPIGVLHWNGKMSKAIRARYIRDWRIRSWANSDRRPPSSAKGRGARGYAIRNFRDDIGYSLASSPGPDG